MTVFGKILVFLNLVFSIVVGVFALMTHVASQDYKKANSDFEKKYQILQASHEAYKKEATDLREEKTALNAKLQESGVSVKSTPDKLAQNTADELKARDDQIANLKKDKEKLTTDLAAATKKADAAVITSLGGTTVVEAREEETRNLRKAFEDKAKENIQLVGTLNKMRDRTVDAELKWLSSKERVESLIDDVKRLNSELVQARANFVSGSPTPPGVIGKQPIMAKGPVDQGQAPTKFNPPTENVEGRITKVDGLSLIGISVGTDAGVTRGNTMSVFRLTEGGKYIGQVRIVSSLPGSSVGQWIDRPKTTPKVGDTVGSSILGN